MTSHENILGHGQIPHGVQFLINHGNTKINGIAGILNGDLLAVQNFSDSKKYSVISSRGDSMTPFIQDRDKLIVEHWQGGQIVDNCVYVFRYANELFVKRLVKNITQIVIKSDNPLYEPIKITDKDQDFEVIGQIVGLMRDLR